METEPKEEAAALDMGAWAAKALEEAAERRARMVAHWAKAPPETHFNVYDIAAWEKLAEAANVPFVPLERLATWNTIDILTAETMPEVPADALARLQPPGSVARWSHCTGMWAKLYMGAGGGHQWHEDMAMAYFGDERVYDLLLDYPAAELALYRRDWVPAAVLNDFPVEYRVFVHNDRVQAISNYYLQRPLPNDSETLHHLAAMVIYTNRMIAMQQKPMNVGPRVPKWINLDQNSWTVDFVVSKGGALMVIDGGPPWGMNADPCCFPLGFDPPNGIALTDLSGRSAKTRVPSGKADE